MTNPGNSKATVTALNAINEKSLRGLAVMLTEQRKQHFAMVAAMQPTLEQYAKWHAAQAPARAAQLKVMAAAGVALSDSLKRSGYLEAIGRLSELASVYIPPPSDDGLARLNDLLDANDVDELELDAIGQALVLDEDVSDTIEAAVAEVAERALITPERARRLIVFFVWLCTSGALLAVSSIPLLSTLPSILGADAPKIARAAGKAVADGFSEAAQPDDD